MDRVLQVLAADADDIAVVSYGNTTTQNEIFKSKCRWFLEKQEPDFVGVAKAFDSNDPDSIEISLERSVARLVGKATGSKIWWGIGSTRLHIDIPGNKSTCALKLGHDYELVVKVANNNYDPQSQMALFKLSSSAKKRRGEFGTVTKFDGKFNPSTIPDVIPISGKKYGESSYLIKLPSLQAGEYGIFVSNPDQANSTSIIVYTFRIEK